ncbi:MAG: isopenicillin N synthase family oxygenase [Magnetospirillum sp.]|nr:isopenicillin N synthase family oxygenase [Magnetospirillum sp.]
MTLPVIDLGPMFGTDARARVRLVEQVRHAAQRIGFLYVTNHGVPPELFQRLEGRAREFFAQPAEVKQRWFIGNSTNHRGYVPPGEETFTDDGTGRKDYKEAFDTALDLPADDPDYRAGNRLLGPNVWPELPGFAEDVRAYYQAVMGVGRTLLHAFALALDLPEGHFDRFVTKPTSQLRLIHYPENDLPVDEHHLGIGSHTDYECFTLLHATGPGLQVVDISGEWVDAPPLPGAFVVNIGDMLEAWSNGRFVATSHRVINTRRERYSFPLFFATDYDTVVEPLPQCVPPGEAPRFPPLQAGRHLEAQTMRTFRYLRHQAAAAGKVMAPPSVQFGRDRAQG